MHTKTIILLSCLLTFQSFTFAEELKNDSPSPVENEPPTESDTAKESKSRESKQMKWLEPASFILSNLKDTNLKPQSTKDDVQGRFFQVVQKGESVNQIDILYSVLRTALEDWGDAFENFARKFENFVDRLETLSRNNQVGIAAIQEMLDDFETQGLALANSISASSGGLTMSAQMGGAGLGGILGGLTGPGGVLGGITGGLPG